MTVEPLAVASNAPCQDRLDALQPSLIANAEIVRRLLPEFDQVSITVLDRTGSTVTCAQAGDVVGHLDRLQYGLDEGPCIDSIRGDLRVVAPHIQRDTRWSRYVSSAAELGLRAQVSAPLGRRGDGPMGALNMYSTTVGDVASAAPSVAEALAVQVAGLLDSSREIANLQHALAGRKNIGIAVGLLMAEYRLSESAAFSVLRRCSAHTNMKVRDIAARMVADGNTSVVMPKARTRRGERHVTATAARDGSTSLPQETPAREVTHEYLQNGGLSVHPPARLHVDRVTHQTVPGLSLIMTDPDGTVTRRQLDRNAPSP